MATPIKSHLPLISTRIDFKYDTLPVPPHITARRDFTISLRKHLRQMSAPYSQTRELTPMRSVRFRDRSNSPVPISIRKGSNEDPSGQPAHNTLMSLPIQTTIIGRSVQSSQLAKAQNRSDSPLTDISDDVSEIGDSREARAPIPKPTGEAGRSNSGGYNLQTALGWDEKRFKDFIKHITNKIEGFLDPSVCFSKQNIATLDEVMKSTTKHFKIEGQYEKDWPVRDAFKLQLKYSSEYAKKKSERRMAIGIKKAASVLNARNSGGNTCSSGGDTHNSASVA